MKAQIVKHQNQLPSAPNPANLLQMALEKGVDTEQLNKLMDLQERWEKKEARKSFFDALSHFQTLVPELKKLKVAKINSAKGNYSYKFADLGSIAKQINPHLRECGLSYRWDFKEKGGNLEVTCHVSHRDGHEEITTMEAGRDDSGYKNAIQQKGSTQTYLQRYTLIGALGLSTADEDNDGKNGQPAARQENKADAQTAQFTEDEILQQWQDLVNQASRQIELQGLYLKNKRVVDSDEKIKAIFSARQVILKQNFKPETVKLP